MSAVPVLVITTSAGCPACKVNVGLWGPLTQKLKETTNLEVIEIKQDYNFQPVDTTKYPAAVNRYIQWLPNLALLPGTSWAAAMQHREDPEYPLEAELFNGDVDEKGLVQQKRNRSPMDIPNIVTWVNEVLSRRGWSKSKTATPSVPWAVPLTEFGVVIPNAGMQNTTCGTLMILPKPTGSQRTLFN